MRLKDEFVAMMVDLAATRMLLDEEREIEAKRFEAQLELLSLAAVGGAARSLGAKPPRGGSLPRVPDNAPAPPPPIKTPKGRGRKVVGLKFGTTQEW